MTEPAVPGTYREITDTCFINAPFDQLRDGDLLDLCITNRLQPEIGLEGNALWDLKTDDFKQVAAVFQEKNLACTLHAPFFDLSPGGFDARVVAITREKLGRAFDLLPIFKPQSIVCHLGFEENKHRGKFDNWLATALETWQQLLKKADRYNTRVMFENTYEKSPEIHKILFEQLDADNLGFCMDTGHLTAFAHTSWQPWLAELSPWLGQLHLHDNDGAGDNHLALGRGIFDFHELFEYLNSSRSTPPLLTLEPHSKEDLWQSLSYIKKTLLF
jgi:sugar phosphate isomerase/epimerase